MARLYREGEGRQPTERDARNRVGANTRERLWESILLSGDLAT